MRYLGLLRGINVGSKNRLRMVDLQAVFVEAGCSQVGTYIQSGNVIFEASSRLLPRIPAIVSDIIASRYGYRVPVIVRSLGEIQETLAHNPFLAEGFPESSLHVMFLEKPPTEEAVEGLDPLRSPGDHFQVRGREIYLHLPGGAAHSKLSNAWFDARLKTVSTGRNWATVRSLAGLLQPK